MVGNSQRIPDRRAGRSRGRTGIHAGPEGRTMPSSTKRCGWSPARHEPIHEAPVRMAGTRARGRTARVLPGPETAGHQFAGGGKKVPWWGRSYSPRSNHCPKCFAAPATGASGFSLNWLGD
jgi:hypothetical protein